MIMKFSNLQLHRPLVCLVAGLLLSTAALAEKPDGAGGGNGGHSNGNGNGNGNGSGNGSGNGNGNGKRDRPDNSEQNMRQGRPVQGSGADQAERSGQERKSRKASAAGPVNIGSYFVDNQRKAVRTYYGDQYSAGRCPPGLAKKNNGCMPPGQARKWAVGQQLPRDVTYYSVPQSVVTQLGAAPSSYKYVRVAADILLIATGTNLVVDAIPNLGRL